MSSFGIAIFIATILVMIVFHEFGHFFAARKFGVKVEEFYVGFGPKIWSTRRGETEFGVKAILAGGYVKIAGMNPWQTVPTSELPRTYGAKPSWQRAVILVAGSFTHFIFGAVLFSILFGVVGVHNPDRPTTTVSSVNVEVNDQKGPAAAAGIRKGDHIVAIDGARVETWNQIRSAIRAGAGRQMEITVERGGAERVFRVTPKEVEVPKSVDDPAVTERVGQIGIVPDFVLERESPPVALWKGIKTTGQSIVLSASVMRLIFSADTIKRVFTTGGDSDRGADSPFGVIGAARLSGEAASQGAVETILLFLAGFIVFVGVINLAPLPPLDGGHLLVVLIEKISGRKVDMRALAPVAAVVLIFFSVLALKLAYLDIVSPIRLPF